ncbi:MAG: hypothetical protein JWM27_2166 [Gemmatimonadetes bacterium]|nr:hypothetical protein [Gemmatimonadota bacterium]
MVGAGAGGMDVEACRTTERNASNETLLFNMVENATIPSSAVLATAPAGMPAALAPGTPPA